MWLTNEILNKLTDWAETDRGNKTVDIKINWKGLEVYVYDFKCREGMYIKEDTNIDDIDKMLKEKADAEMFKHYIELRDRFEYNKEGD
jgi:Holliday junction resolvase